MKSEILKKMIKNVSSTTALKVEKIAFNLMIPGLEKEHNIQILLAYVRGSHMYGLATEKSDVDITFVYRQPTEEILRTNYLSQLNIGGNDIVGYEIQRFLELLTLNNPNILEALDIPDDCLIYKSKEMDSVLDQKYWVSKLTEKTILGYAQSQIKKATGLKKNMNNPQPVERKDILDFCYIIQNAETKPLKEWAHKNQIDLDRAGLSKLSNGKGIFILYPDNSGQENLRGLIKDSKSSQLRLSTIPKTLINNEHYVMYYNLDGFEVHCKQHRAYWEWKTERNEERHLTNQKHGKNYDSKNIMHLFRLLEMAHIVSISGQVKVRTDTPEWLLSIKEGAEDYATLMEGAEWLSDTITKLFEMSNLQEKPSVEKTKEILLEFRTI